MSSTPGLPADGHLQIGVQAPPVTTVGQTVDELESLPRLGLAERRADPDQHRPILSGRAAHADRRLLAGREMDEPFELWSGPTAVLR